MLEKMFKAFSFCAALIGSAAVHTAALYEYPKHYFGPWMNGVLVGGTLTLLIVWTFILADTSLKKK